VIEGTSRAHRQLWVSSPAYASRSVHSSERRQSPDIFVTQLFEHRVADSPLPGPAGRRLQSGKEEQPP
jgi:hypothetical protein